MVQKTLKMQEKSPFSYENRLFMAPQVGFEPTTLRLTGGYIFVISLLP